MNLKQLIKKIKSLKKDHEDLCKKKMYSDNGLTTLEDFELQSIDGELKGIKQTVEAIDFDVKIDIILTKDKVRYELWQEIKSIIFKTKSE